MSNDMDQDVAKLWADAVASFEARTKTPVSTLRSITSVEQLIASLAYKKSIFKKRRRNGSKIERVRTLASKALGPIYAISDVLSQATKLVSIPLWGHISPSRLVRPAKIATCLIMKESSAQSLLKRTKGVDA